MDENNDVIRYPWENDNCFMCANRMNYDICMASINGVIYGCCQEIVECNSFKSEDDLIKFGFNTRY